MDVDSYFASMMEGLEFIRALGSIIGILGFVIGLLMLVSGGRAYKKTGVRVVIICIALLFVCGPDTGIKYFRIL
jgi:hypothetical protein